MGLRLQGDRPMFHILRAHRTATVVAAVMFFVCVNAVSAQPSEASKAGNAAAAGIVFPVDRFRDCGAHFCRADTARCLRPFGVW
jgi:hypothetical protein